MKGFWEKYSWQQKNKWLGWGALIFLFMVYQLSIKETLELRSAYQAATAEKLSTQQKETELSQLKARMQQIGNASLIGEGNSGNLKVNMLNSVASAAENNGLVIKDVPPTKAVTADGLTVNYDEYCLVGSYNDLLQCWYEIEKGKELNLVNVAFRKEANTLTKASELKMYLTTAYVARN
ncbi:hypothetical protein RYH73_06420 [Olivibacter sp. CPCC 100613]|uniref:hypothetical protein n=1 Tax=Olivibacter sp. CPCC 100613 TaxID=3079931 RepID=UPI002FF624DD